MAFLFGMHGIEKGFRTALQLTDGRAAGLFLTDPSIAVSNGVDERKYQNGHSADGMTYENEHLLLTNAKCLYLLLQSRIGS